MPSTDFVVARNDLQQCKVIETQLPDAAALPDDALLVKVTKFAFTANNITYAVLGDHLKYWQLFPAPEGFGNVPVWGLGEVIASKHPGIAAGETLFGYFPMATHLVIEAADVHFLFGIFYHPKFGITTGFILATLVLIAISR